MLNLSRVHVFRLIQSGQIPAIKIGRNFAIRKSDLGIYAGELSTKEKNNVNRSVDKVIKEYGETIKKLGEE